MEYFLYLQLNFLIFYLYLFLSIFIQYLDLLFENLINEKYNHKEFFDFGQSTEQMGAVLNENLIFQKEGFGARGVCYDTYKYDI